MTVRRSISAPAATADTLLHAFSLVMAGIAVALTILIAFFLVHESWPVFAVVDPWRFFADGSWHPTAGHFNLMPMAVGTVLTSLGALTLGIPAGLSVAIFCRYYAPRPIAGLYRLLIRLLAGTPSVIFGFWGLVTLAPMLARISPPGTSVLAGAMILAMMIIPTIALTAESAFASLPRHLTAGAEALGLDRWTTIRRIFLPAARQGVLAGLVLAVGRAIGETMAVLMVCGNAADFPAGPMHSTRTLTANMALEMPYAMGMHRAALFVSGLLLMVVVTALVGLSGRVRRPEATR